MSNNSVELFKDIVAFASILQKFGCEEGLESQTVFIEMLNEAGFRTTSGKEFTKMSYRKMVERLPEHIKKFAFDNLEMGRYSRC